MSKWTGDTLRSVRADRKPQKIELLPNLKVAKSDDATVAVEGGREFRKFRIFRIL